MAEVFSTGHTSYPNDTAITVIKTAKNASSFLRPEIKISAMQLIHFYFTIYCKVQTS